METKRPKEGFLHIYSNDIKINTKPISFDMQSNMYKGEFWASKSGRLDYKVELIYGDKPLIVSESSVQVQESQIELNHVYLNKEPLNKLADATKGSFQEWGNRNSIINKVNSKSVNEITQSRIIMHNNYWVFILILVLLTSEWILRRNKGMI